jgi:hypothetical protein
MIVSFQALMMSLSKAKRIQVILLVENQSHREVAEEHTGHVL